MKLNFRPCLAGLTGLLQLVGGLAFCVTLLPHRPVARNLQLQPIGKRVDDRNAYAVQTAGNFVGVAIEFSARVQNREHDFRRGTLLRRVHVHWDAAAVVDHSDGFVGVYRDVDLVREAGHRFVDRVVDHFPHEMVQAHLPGRADVHRRAQAHGFQAAQDFDRFRVVLVAALGRASHVFFVFFVAHFFLPCPEPALRVKGVRNNFSHTCCVAQTPGNSECGSAVKKHFL